MRIIELNSFNQVSASARSTLQINQEFHGMTLLGLMLVRGGTTFTAAHMTAVSVKLGSKTIVPPEMTGTRLDTMNADDGATTVANHTFINFALPLLTGKPGYLMGAIDRTMYPEPITLEIDIGAATAPTLKAYAIVLEERKAVALANAGVGKDVVGPAARLFRVLNISKIVESQAVTDKAETITYGSQAGGSILALRAFHTNLTDVSFKEDGADAHDKITVATNAAVRQQFKRKVPQSGLYTLDFVADSHVSSALQTVRNGRVVPFVYKVTTSDADSIDVIADTLQTLETA